MRGFISRLSKREKTVLYVSAVIVLLAVVDRAVLHPIIHNMKSFEEEIRKTEYDMTKNLKILQQRRRIEEEEKRYSSFAVRAHSVEEATATLLREIENLASVSSVHLIDLKPAGVTSEAEVQKFLINVNCEAAMEKLISFMYSVENSDILMQIGAFTISPKSKASGVKRCELLVYKIAIP